MAKKHSYAVTVAWTGNTGAGTGAGTGADQAYERAYEVRGAGKPAILGSSDPAFRGDAGRWNPEELLVASLSACHQLWYLALCAGAGVVVTAYEDEAEGVMTEEASGAGQFEAVTLRPRVTVSGASDPALAMELHHRAHAMCFIARSVAFPVRVEAAVTRGAAA